MAGLPETQKARRTGAIVGGWQLRRGSRSSQMAGRFDRIGGGRLQGETTAMNKSFWIGCVVGAAVAAAVPLAALPLISDGMGLPQQTPVHLLCVDGQGNISQTLKMVHQGIFVGIPNAPNGVSLICQ